MSLEMFSCCKKCAENDIIGKGNFKMFKAKQIMIGDTWFKLRVSARFYCNLKSLYLAVL